MTATPPYLPNPAVTYSYDSGANAIGHLTSLTDPAGSASYTYDPLGRMSGEQRTLNGVSKSMSYQYYLDGSTNTLKYPSGGGDCIHAKHGSANALRGRQRQQHPASITTSMWATAITEMSGESSTIRTPRGTRPSHTINSTG